MLKADVNKGYVNIDIEGSVPEIGADLCVLIKHIHSSIFEKNTMAAVAFRQALTRMIMDESLELFKIESKEGNNNE